jgi:threonine aldolase
MPPEAGDDFADRFRAAARLCERTVFWRRTLPADDLARLAAACEELGIDEWDGYGSRGAVTMLETQVAELLGKPAALFVPSGTLAQQAVLRIWCDRSGSRRVALPDLSHLVHHEEDGPRRLHGLEWEFLTVGRRTPVAADLAAVPGLLGAALTELPLRDAGCLLPSWDDLAGLSAAAREGGVPLHLDGARLWESQPFYDRPLAEVAGLFDSVYVSFYKGLGAQAGACVAADEDVVDELRSWRKRMGGTLFTMTPYAVGGLLGLRDELPRMGEYAEWARSLAAALAARGLRVHPAQPGMCTFEVYADGLADEVNERLLAFMEAERTQLCGPFRQTDDPGTVVAELACYAAATEHEPEVVADWLARVVGVAERPQK